MCFDKNKSDVHDKSQKHFWNMQIYFQKYLYVCATLLSFLRYSSIVHSIISLKHLTMLTYQNTQTIKGGQPNIHVKKDNNEVCVYLDQEKAEDYAKTIKAIPQMLEALKELVNAADFKMGKKAFELIIEMAINAIELAEGRIE